MKLEYEDYLKIDGIIEKINNSDILTQKEKDIISSRVNDYSEEMTTCYKKLFDKLVKQFCPDIYIFSNKPNYNYIPRFSLSLLERYVGYRNKLLEIENTLDKKDYKVFYNYYINTKNSSNKICFIEWVEEKFSKKYPISLEKMLDIARYNDFDQDHYLKQLGLEFLIKDFYLRKGAQC